MPRHTGLILALATLSATAVVSLAQNASPAGQENYQTNNAPMQSQPAPIERADTGPYGRNRYITKLAVGQDVATRNGTASVLATTGVFLRVGDRSSIRAVALGGENTELRVEHGVVNISVHHPVKNAQILVDLPGGQTALIKDGFYTFNADTNTARVLKGEAFGYPGSDAHQKPLKIKENHALIFNGPNVAPFEFDPYEARADLIPYAPQTGGPGSSGYYGDNGPSMGYPYYGYGYPYYGGYYPYWGWDYPFGFGFYGGGFYGGGWRGGGFHGGRGRR